MRLDGVGKRYGPRGSWVVREVGVELPPGVLVRASGGNGSGKSTLLRILAGVTRPSRGRVLDGYARRAYVPERFAPGLPFSARLYLEHLGRLHGLRGHAPARRAGEVLERFGAAGFADRPLRELSKGSCQKVAVAQAVLGEPELVVLDEAWTGLDQAARQTLDEVVAEQLAAGTAVVFVDHDPTRLGGWAAAHWTFADGRVHAAEPGAGLDGEGPPLRIALRGVAASALPELSQLRGVLAARAEEDERVVVTVSQKCSDELLRAVLADPAVHVEEVR
ncbi:ABC-2 type transport system ATP-binding protein [Streptacidiphilus sp. MAP12-20]|uniref:ATP-binding cassette domain-containing protein n=1 Tax=Streptacidiphilus sp. MAP12-20 TaxID=3156299 RepID=UPI003517B274